MATVSTGPVPLSHESETPLLEAGDRLTRAEFAGFLARLQSPTGE